MEASLAAVFSRRLDWKAAVFQYSNREAWNIACMVFVGFAAGALSCCGGEAAITI